MDAQDIANIDERIKWILDGNEPRNEEETASKKRLARYYHSLSLTSTERMVRNVTLTEVDYVAWLDEKITEGKIKKAEVTK